VISSGFVWPGDRIEVRRSALSIRVLDASTPRPVGTLGLDGGSAG
jgi:hypothetical protein